MVSADDVIITNFMDDSQGLQVSFYVRETNGILSAVALANAVEVSHMVATVVAGTGRGRSG